MDGDDIRCRWADSNECGGICNGVPLAALDSVNCEITFPANHTIDGWFEVAITVEDFPKTTITVGGNAYTSSQALSSIPLQFLINTQSLNGSCTDRPIFVSPTPADGSVTIVTAGDTLAMYIYAYSIHGISAISLVSPAGVNYSKLIPDDIGRHGVNYIIVVWTPTASQQGSHILCAQADDNSGKAGDSRCLTIIAWDINTCNRSSASGFKNCSCEAGFTGALCDIDIDECANLPCHNGATCNDHLNAYTCKCQPGYTGMVCETDINGCRTEPCGVLKSCIDAVNGYRCQIIPIRLAAVVLACFLTSLALGSFLIIRKRKQTELNKWWSQFETPAKPDIQSKTVFRPSSRSGLNTI